MNMTRGDEINIYVIPSPPFGLGIVCPTCGRTAVIRELPFDIEELPPHKCHNNATFKTLFMIHLAQGSVEKKTYVAPQDGEQRIVLRNI